MNAGDTGTFMLQLVPDNIFTGTVNFICPGNLPLQTTCTFTPPSVNGDDAGDGGAVQRGVSDDVARASEDGRCADTERRPAVEISLRGVRLARCVDRGDCGCSVTLRCRSALCRSRARLRWRLALQPFSMAAKAAAGQAKEPPARPPACYKMTVQATAQSAPRGVTVTLDVQ